MPPWSRGLTAVLVAINAAYKVRGAGIRITGLPEGGRMKLRLVLTALPGIPLIGPGERPGRPSPGRSGARAGMGLEPGDVLVYARRRS